MARAVLPTSPQHSCPYMLPPAAATGRNMQRATSAKCLSPDAISTARRTAYLRRNRSILELAFDGSRLRVPTPGPLGNNSPSNRSQQSRPSTPQMRDQVIAQMRGRRAGDASHTVDTSGAASDADEIEEVWRAPETRTEFFRVRNQEAGYITGGPFSPTLTSSEYGSRRSEAGGSFSRPGTAQDFSPAGRSPAKTSPPGLDEDERRPKPMRQETEIARRYLITHGQGFHAQGRGFQGALHSPALKIAHGLPRSKPSAHPTRQFEPPRERR